jgi:hypothetical protein
MGDDKNQRNAFQFLSEHFSSQEPFSQDDLCAVTDWQRKTFPTYWSKHYKTFVVPVGKNRFRVSESFRPFLSWERFREHVTQMRRASSDYSWSVYGNLLVYEFFMPLTHEGALRTTLDALFFKDTLLTKVKALDRKALEQRFPREPEEGDDTYFERLCAWISKRFVGYSVSHVSGRFRAEEIATHQDAALVENQGRRYLIDETTAVVKFIFPFGEPKTVPLYAESDEADAEDEEVPSASKDAKQIDWLFHELFVKSVVQVVNGEAEIWMVESGLRNRLHIWKVQ